MTLTGILLVAGGAALGAPVRYLLTRVVALRHPSFLALGTLGVNVLGSLILGVVVGIGAPLALLALGVGFCGALTTFSSFAVEVAELSGVRRHRMALTTVLLSLVVCVAAAGVGLLLGRAIA